MTASRSGNPEVVRLLLAKGAKANVAEGQRGQQAVIAGQGMQVTDLSRAARQRHGLHQRAGRRRGHGAGLLDLSEHEDLVGRRRDRHALGLQ